LKGVEKKGEARLKRHRRVRKKVYGTAGRPRLSVYKSNRHIFAQIIDDDAGHTLASASSLALTLVQEKGQGGKKEVAKTVGRILAEAAVKAEVRRVVFDRGGYRYHGRVRALADGARESGLEF
jgi:large subunit ribosomal protein L18